MATNSKSADSTSMRSTRGLRDITMANAMDVLDCDESDFDGFEDDSDEDETYQPPRPQPQETFQVNGIQIP